MALHPELSAHAACAEGLILILHAWRLLRSQDNTQCQEILSANHAGTLYVELALWEAHNCWPILRQVI